MKFSIVVSILAAASSASTVAAGPDADTIAACPGGGAYCCSRCAVNLKDCFDACGESLKNCPYGPDTIFRPTAACGAECCGKCVPTLSDGVTVSFKDCLSKCGVRCDSTVLPVCACPQRKDRIRGDRGNIGGGTGSGIGAFASRCSNTEAYCCGRCAVNLNDCYAACGKTLNLDPLEGAFDLVTCRCPPTATAATTKFDFVAACPEGQAYCCGRCAVSLNDCYAACGEWGVINLDTCPTN